MIITADFVLQVTFFDNHQARTKEEKSYRLGDLADLIRTTNRNGADAKIAKGTLPWLKLGIFGTMPTGKGSLRWDGNLLRILGIEGDYDDERMSFEQAVEVAEKAGLGCLLYTSPSHRPERPHWRILAPTFISAPPAIRTPLLARVNGLYGGIFSGESWVLSQSYYFGSIFDNPHHQVAIIEGQPVDELDELDHVAIGPPSAPTVPPGRGRPQTPAGGRSPSNRKPSDLGPALDLLDVGACLACIDNPPAQNWKRWSDVGMAVFAATAGSTAGLAAFHAWSEKAGAAVYDDAKTDARWAEFTASPPRIIGGATLIFLAKQAWPSLELPSQLRRRREQDPGEPPEDNEPPPAPDPKPRQLPEGVQLADFRAYMPQHKYIFAATGELWPASSVNARLPPIKIGVDKEGKDILMSAAAWLDRNQPVEQMSWAPGRPQIIADRLIAEGGWIERKGVSIFNLYRAPASHDGDPRQAGRWIAHVETVYPEDAAHIIAWLAQRVQRPHEKINHALVLGGTQGIGKDSLLEPVKRAVGAWNVAEPSPVQLTARFNGFVKSVILRISEGHDLGELDRYAFYEHLKIFTAAPPDVIRVDQKHIHEHNVFNVCGVIITTNHLTDGMYLPAEDRRHYVAWSKMTKDDFPADYWRDLWGWYDDGGDQHVAAYLASLDLSDFDAKAPPPKTEAFWSVVNANRSTEDSELADCLDLLDNPPATTLQRIIATADGVDSLADFVGWLKDRRNRRVIGHRFEACGYTAIRNPDADDGRWKVKYRRVVIYVRETLTFHAQLAAARKLT